MRYSCDGLRRRLSGLIGFNDVVETLTVRRAHHRDLGSLVRLRDQAARWQQAQGREQWTVGERELEYFAAHHDAGELFVAETHDHQVVGSVAITFQDEKTWGRRADDAGYVHGLIIERRHAGQRLGVVLLTWAERRIASAGRSYSRLDYVSHNDGLEHYYARSGYVVVGTKEFEGTTLHPVTLAEKKLSTL
jgi:ribosomal protein S18 acetylase RimI-like enzyme